MLQCAAEGGTVEREWKGLSNMALLREQGQKNAYQSYSHLEIAQCPLSVQF